MVSLHHSTPPPSLPPGPAPKGALGMQSRSEKGEHQPGTSLVSVSGLDRLGWPGRLWGVAGVRVTCGCPALLCTPPGPDFQLPAPVWGVSGPRGHSACTEELCPLGEPPPGEMGVGTSVAQPHTSWAPPVSQNSTRASYCLQWKPAGESAHHWLPSLPSLTSAPLLWAELCPQNWNPQFLRM